MRWSPTIAIAVAIVGLSLATTGARAAELVRDGGFEGGGSSWVQEDNRDFETICAPIVPGCQALQSSARPRTGAWWAWFGGWPVSILFGAQHSKIHQTVSAAAGTPLTLTFWLWLGSSTENATLHVLLDDQVLFAVRGNDARFHEGYVPVSVPVHGSLVTGVPQRLAFEFAAVPGGLPELPFFRHAINIDDVSLQAPDADLGVGLSSTPSTVTQGATFATTINAGNAGPHAADAVWASFPLPTGATLVGLTGDAACSAAETKPGHVMHCDFGALPSGTTKAVTATFSADAVGTVSQHASIGSRTGDPNAGNNVAHSAVTVVAPTAPPGGSPPAKPTCTAPRRFTVPLRRGNKGTALMIGKHSTARSKILSARLTGPKRFKTQKLRHSASKVTVDLRKLAAGRYTVRARVRVSSRKTINATRTYTACGATAASVENAAATSEKTKKTSEKTKKTSTKTTATAKK